MSRGFLVGAGWGIVVAGVGLVVASQVADFSRVQPEQRPAPSAVVDAPTASQSVLDIGAPVVGQDTGPSLASTDTQAAPQPDVPAAFDGTTLNALPEAVGSDSLTETIIAEGDSAAIPQVQTLVAAPNPPEETGIAPSAPTEPEGSDIDPARNTSDLPTSAVSELAPEADTNLPPILREPVEPSAEIVPVAPQGPIVTPEITADASSIPPTDDLTRAPIQNVPPQEAAQPDAPAMDEIAVEDALGARPAPGFVGAIDGVKTGRLPSIGGEPVSGAIAAPDRPLPADAMAAAADDPSLPPVERFARPFTNVSGKPLFAILLQDTGGPRVDREALAAIPFPVSFVIDPTLPDAATAANIYRAAGQEVLMLASGIPSRAKPSDLAISFEAMAVTLPESVAVVDLEQGGFQGNRTLASQVITVIQDQGRGVISWDRGLNAASQVARREGVSNATIFRALDANDEKSPVIRRYLDRAAFKAAQDGRVMVAGHTRPETVTALLEWAVEGRAATVTIAPATAVMTSQ